MQKTSCLGVRAQSMLVTAALWLGITMLVSCSHRMAPPKPYLAFADIPGSHSVVVINLARFKRVRAIQLDFAPSAIQVRPHSRELVATGTEGKLAVIGSPALQVTRMLRAPAGPVQLVFSPDGARAYIAGGDQISVYDCACWTRVRVFPLHAPLARIALAPGGEALLGEDAADSRLVFISAANGALLGSVALDKDPGPMVAVRSKLFVANPAEDAITAIDVPSRAVLSRIETAGPPTLLALKPDGGELFALSGPKSTITILDTQRDNVEQSLPAGESAAAAVFTADSGTLYVANAGDGTVDALDVATRKIIASVRVGVQPIALALTPDERFLLAADRAGGSLAIMRARPLSLVTTIPVGPDPAGVLATAWELNAE